MIPPFQITPPILDTIGMIERLLGRFESLNQPKPQPQLRKSNRIRTVQGSLAIEGNTLSFNQITALMDGKKVIGKPREIREVMNAIEVYNLLKTFRPHSLQDLLKSHRIMMHALVPSAGKWRKGNVGVLKGSRIAHMAPPHDMVPHLMKDLFAFIKKDNSHALIKSAVFHYELEFIHPFEDGNGRIGRFWHSLLLFQYHPAFEFAPIESLIKANQKEYYHVLGLADKAGDSTMFIEFSLNVVKQAFTEYVEALRPGPSTSETRLEVAKSHFADIKFSRKDYLSLFKTISTATASRDLKAAVEKNVLEKSGDKAQTNYRFKMR